VCSTRSLGLVWTTAGILAVGGCATRVAGPDVPLTSPAELCHDAALDAKSFCLPTQAEEMLRTGQFDVKQVRTNSTGIGGSDVFVLEYPGEHTVIKAKWSTSKKGGTGFNTNPRKEIAAFKVQMLFLEPEEYVVPPTVGRCLEDAAVRDLLPKVKGAFEGAPCVFGVLQYWLINVTDKNVFDAARFESDPAYRRSVADMNLLTYLIDHRDTKQANFLISTDPKRPRAFSVDNGMAFSGFRNPIAYFKEGWAKIIVPALPKKEIERLRKLTRHDLDTLLTVSQYSVTPHGLVEVPATAAISDEEGVRREGDVIQIGLTRDEVDGIENRLKTLLGKVDRDEIKVF
jgi:hypothetical protein